MFAKHCAFIAPILVWLLFVCAMPLWLYAAAFIYPGTAFALLRSYAEHRADDAVGKRTAIVEGSWILGPLFLFNNLHQAHHTKMSMPWYRLPGWYARNREALVAHSGGLVYRGYFEVARRFLLRPHDQLVHPGESGRAP